MNESREKISIRTNIIGIGVNILLFVFKFFVGTISNSVSIVADSYNNLTDSLSNIISMLGVYLSNKPANDKHPYGYGRIEYIAAFIVSFLVLQVGILTLISSIRKFFEKEDILVSNFVIIVLVVSIVTKILLGLYYRNVGKKIDSDIFIATSADSLSDSCITFGTLIVVIVFKFFHINIDSIVGVIVSIIIIVNGFKIVLETTKPIIGEKIDREYYKLVKDFVHSYNEVQDTHDLIVHNYGPDKYMCSIHVEVDKTKDIEYLHEIIDKIEFDFKVKYNSLLVIHLDPIDLHNPKVIEYKNIVANVIENVKTENGYDGLSFHDFRCVFGKENSNLIFDIVVPWKIKDDNLSEFLDSIRKKIKDRIDKVSIVFNVDRPY